MAAVCRGVNSAYKPLLVSDYNAGTGCVWKHSFSSVHCSLNPSLSPATFAAEIESRFRIYADKIALLAKKAGTQIEVDLLTDIRLHTVPGRRIRRNELVEAGLLETFSEISSKAFPAREARRVTSRGHLLLVDAKNHPTHDYRRPFLHPSVNPASFPRIFRAYFHISV
jgi:hypothetical protein